MDSNPMETIFSILVFPWLAHGHVFPYFELAKKLAKKNFKIYFCSTPVNLSSINDGKSSSASSSIQFVELHLPSTPEFPQHYHTTKNLPPHLMPKLHEALNMSKSSFSDILSSLRPNLLIYDAFQTWAVEQASSLGIPSIHFATTGAAAYSFYYHRTIKDTPFPYESMYLRDSERKALDDLISNVGSRDDSGSIFRHLLLSHGIILMKTCKGLEGKYIEYLSDLCDKKVIPVGALVTESDNNKNNSSTSDKENRENAEIVEWLNNKKQSSTVFISLGSENYFNRDQLTEIAKGLESTEVNFIWVIRFPHGEKISAEEALPEGFFSTVRDRGLILEKWAPQAQILAHSSTGAFVSHCGASSIIESIYFGVPVVALPLKIDQPLNAKLLVEAGVGLEVERDEIGNFTGENFAKAINKVVLEKTGEEMRLKAVELGFKIKSEQESAIDETAEMLMQVCKQPSSNPQN